MALMMELLTILNRDRLQLTLWPFEGLGKRCEGGIVACLCQPLLNFR